MPDGLSENYYFGGGGDTLISAAALTVFIAASVLILLLPRKYLAVPFLLAGLTITVREQLVVGEFHFTIYRLLLMVAWIRIACRCFVTRCAPLHGRMTSLDKLFVAWAFSNALIYTILWWDLGALINRLGFLYSTLGTYFLVRYLIRTPEDMLRAIKTLAVVSILIGTSMLVEHSTGHNPFALFGGVSDLSEVRYGRVRAQGPFLHAIVAGTFGAMLLPLFSALWVETPRSRVLSALAIISCVVIAGTSSSSTPVMTLIAALIGCAVWPLRTRMQLIRWGMVILLVALQLSMKVPIWFLISRVSVLTGGTGWHRSQLIDQFIRHFGEWWLIGTRNNNTWGLDMWDSINAYVNSGVGGGLLTLSLFVGVLIYAYRSVGRSLIVARHERLHEYLVWALGAALFCNTVAFFGIIYFDQSAIAWYSLLAMISVSPFAPVRSRRSSLSAHDDQLLQLRFSTFYPISR